jgi:hypothetical protein
LLTWMLQFGFSLMKKMSDDRVYQKMYLKIFENIREPII